MTDSAVFQTASCRVLFVRAYEMSAKCALIADSHGVLVKVHVLLNYYMAWPCGSQHKL